MKKTIFLSIISLCLILVGCIQQMPPENQNDLVLPQVYFSGRAYYNDADIQALENNVIEPLVNYYQTSGSTVVSIAIDNDNLGSDQKNQFMIDVIISNNDGDNEPIYHSFVHEKINGQIPLWEPEEVSEGYQG